MSRVVRPILALLLLAGSPALGDDFPVSIRPALVGNLGVSQVVPPELPFRAGIGRGSLGVW